VKKEQSVKHRSLIDRKMLLFKLGATNFLRAGFAFLCGRFFGTGYGLLNLFARFAGVILPCRHVGSKLVVQSFQGFALFRSKTLPAIQITNFRGFFWLGSVPFRSSVDMHSFASQRLCPADPTGFRSAGSLFRIYRLDIFLKSFVVGIIKETHFALPYNYFTQKVNTVNPSFYPLP